jgi:ATP-dependent Clp protease ATP-binding subunit ClpC
MSIQHMALSCLVAVMAAAAVFEWVRRSGPFGSRIRLERTGGPGGFNFTERMRGSLSEARLIAEELSHGYVGPEHLLAGLLEVDSVAVAVLRNLHVDLAALRKNVLAATTQKRDILLGPDLPYTRQAKRVLEAAVATAQELHHDYVGTEHLLIALTRVTPSPAAIALANVGVTGENARALIPAKTSDPA